MSKRYLRALVEEKLVDGWDDPRMPTLCGLRRRGFTPSSIFEFVKRSGISKALSLCDINLLEHCIREELNSTALRRMAVLDPIEVEITNFDEGKTEYFEVANNPENPDAGTRKVPFTKHLYIERVDFSDNPPPKFQRLKVGSEVRFMSAYVVKCNEVIYGENGEVTKLLCTVDTETAGKNPPDGRKIKGTVHWVSKEHAKDATVRLYDKLFTIENTGEIPEDKTFRDYVNPESLIEMKNAKLEESLEGAKPGERFQFVRNGYFCVDVHNPSVINRIVTLKDSFSKNIK
jgi:glutaminyl-tRNA synthetase